jgi:hypothetical protein
VSDRRRCGRTVAADSDSEPGPPTSAARRTARSHGRAVAGQQDFSRYYFWNLWKRLPSVLEPSGAHRALFSLKRTNLGNLSFISMSVTEQTAESSAELADILNRFDPSAKGKFDRSGHTEWCTDSSDRMEGPSTHKKSIPRNVASRLLCSKSKFVGKVANRLECMKGKLLKQRRLYRRVQKGRASLVSEQITHGSNTPASSRPSSISMTLDQIESLRRKAPAMLSNEGMAS